METTSEDAGLAPRYRIGAVARLANLPVATLRVWERRYGVVSPPRSASGQRFYSEEDIHRVALLRNLVDRGHAIGSIASLDAQQLERLAIMHIDRSPASRISTTKTDLHMVIVGSVLARKIHRCLATLRQERILETAIFENITEAFANHPSRHANLLLLHLPSLHPDDTDRVVALRSLWRVTRVAIVYAFATESTLERLHHADIQTYREPLGKASMWRLLLDLLGPQFDGVVAEEPHYEVPASRRYTDEVLADMAHASVTVTCECPRHLADIIMQLSAFEQYSVECKARTPADAFLHSYLANVSGRARAMFEVALERLEREERWIANRS